MTTQEQFAAYRHKKHSQRKRSRDDENIAFSTDSDSSMEPDQENFTSNLPKQRKVQTTKLTPKQKFKTEKAINDLRIRIQLIDLNDNEPETIDPTKGDAPKVADRCRTPLPSAVNFNGPSRSDTDTNGNILKHTSLLPKRGRTEVSAKNTDKESLSDDEINEKLIKLDIPVPTGPPSNRRVTFGGFSYSAKIDSSPQKTKQVTFGGYDQPAKILKNTQQSEMERIKFSSKKMGRSKTIKEINIEDEWRIYKTANLSLSEFATRTSSFGTK